MGADLAAGPIALELGKELQELANNLRRLAKGRLAEQALQ